MFKIFKKYLKFNIFLSILLVFTLFFTFNSVFANDRKYVIPGGDAIGLKINTGVYVIGKYNVPTKTSKLSPWKSSDILEGDKIVRVNNQTVDNVESLMKIINNSQNEYCNLLINRNNENINTKIDIVTSANGEKTIGLYLKDKLLGIGTLTFIDPDTNTFASLGHGITDKTLSYGKINGCIVTSNIEGIKKGIPGTSGEKRASISSIEIGKIISNNNTGVYGKVTKPLSRKAIPVANQLEVHKGSAVMLTVIDGDKIESFDIEIIGINLQDSTGTKGLKVKIVDEDLIKYAGGIVQGMSGSPIIQDEKLVGAISHVSVSEPTIGYGMHIGWMLEEVNKI